MGRVRRIARWLFGVEHPPAVTGRGDIFDSGRPALPKPPVPWRSRVRQAQARQVCEQYGCTPHGGVCVVCFEPVDLEVPDSVEVTK